MSMYFPTSLATGVQTADVHMQTRFLPPSGVSLHPLQRAGIVPATLHDTMPRQRAYGPPGLADPRFAAAGHLDLTLPPVVPLAGGPRDPQIMV